MSSSSSSSSTLQACMQVCNTHAHSLNVASSHLGVYFFPRVNSPLPQKRTNTHTHTHLRASYNFSNQLSLSSCSIRKVKLKFWQPSRRATGSKKCKLPEQEDSFSSLPLSAQQRMRFDQNLIARSHAKHRTFARLICFFFKKSVWRRSRWDLAKRGSFFSFFSV